MIGERICRLRSQLALSTAEFADLLEVSPRALARWEAGRAVKGPGGPKLVLLRALEDACAKDPAFAHRLREWAPRGQWYVLRQLSQ
jgi:DNA-binding transcriptional regulator YiaG